MDLIAKASGGHNIVARPQALARYYPAGTAPVAYVEVWWRYASQPASQAQLFGTFTPNQVAISFPFNPTVDQPVTFSLIAFSADGVPDVSNLEDAVSMTVLFQRETTAPVIGQVGDATTDSVTVGVSNYTSFARKRRLKRATALSGGALVAPTIEIFDSTPDPPPRYIDISRGAGPQTIYVAVAHSSGDGTSWTPDSNILTLTFASAEGTGGGGGSGSGGPTGGSSGNYNPEPRNQLTL